ncbi:hypothetical protein FACS1894202_10900 [Clostridia bacterium]|nr:hypothetical protein FACS1894202_10900 [Clostridia bacterium]
MNFYVVTNGYTGDGYCRVYVAAENYDRAKQLASEVFKRESDNRLEPYPESYYAVDSFTVTHCLSGNAEGVINEVD